MSELKILYATSEIAPFLETNFVAEFSEKMSVYMKEKEADIRILAPRFGLISERKSRLHEVVRLSGASIAVGREEKKSLAVKVSSIPGAKLQVYFIDNEEYFKRKAKHHDKQGKFFEDNDERTILFCKGVLETVRKLGWSPDIIHCHDWITGLIPAYLKTVYRSEPMLKNTKVIFTLYNEAFAGKFNKDFAKKAHVAGMDKQVLQPLATADFSALIRTGIKHADVVTRAEPLHDAVFQDVLEDKKVQYIEDGVQGYHKLYQSMMGKQ